MKMMPLFLHLAVIGFCACLGAMAATPEPRPADDLRSLVSTLEDQFLAQLETAPDLPRVFDDYEAGLRALIARDPARPEPYVGFYELFEKCETERSLALIRGFQATPELPEKIRALYAQLEKTLALVGTPAGLAFPNLQGETTDVRSLRGKVVIVDFWATWCGPCVREIPKLKTYLAEFGSENLAIVGVSFDDDVTKLRTFVLAQNVPWPQIPTVGAPREQIAAALGITRGDLPAVFLIGRDGRIRHTLNSRFRLREKIEALLAER